MDKDALIKKKIAKLQLEEKQLQDMLKLIQTEINKYEVEQMHLKHLLKSPDSDNQSEENDVYEEQEIKDIIENIDNAEKINQKTLELNRPNTATEEFDEESDSN